MKQKTVLIMAGGTGGHIFPALAVADKLLAKNYNVQWLGTHHGLEANIVPEHNIDVNYIDISGLRGKNLLTTIVMPFKLLRAIYQTLKVYKKIRPDVVLGMGGYVTAPGGLVAWLTKTPLVLHEQNAIAGLSNKLLFRFADTIYAAFPKAFINQIRFKVIGNPVRQDIASIEKPETRLPKKWQLNTDKRELNILIIGGSLGATALNEVIPKTLIKLLQMNVYQKSEFSKINIQHQCGEKNYQQTQKFYDTINQYNEQQKKDQRIYCDIVKFIKTMHQSYQWADLIICRSGALTISEISSVGIASLLVPYPYAVDDHQTINGRFLSDEKAAFLMAQSELTDDKLADLILTLTTDMLLQMATKARSLATKDAAKIVAKQCQNLAELQ